MGDILHRSPPFRAEHIGSLLRPDALLLNRLDEASGKITKDTLRQNEDAAIKEIVDVEIQLGFHSLSDGEYRRSSASHTH